MAVTTMEENMESNRLKREWIEKIKNDMKDVMSQAELEKLEQVFMSASKDYVFRKQTNSL